MPYNLELADALRPVVTAVELLPGEVLAERKMFGGLCFTLDGKMAAGVVKDSIVVRIEQDDFVAGAESGLVTAMDFTGKPMKNFAYLTEKAKPQLGEFVSRSFSYVRKHMR